MHYCLLGGLLHERVNLGLKLEKFIVFSALCFASPAACCWCRVSCCLFLEMKSFGFDEIQSLQVTPG